MFVAVSGNDQIWKRDEPIDPPTEESATFYHGVGQLLEKFALPFSGVWPGSLAVKGVLGTVAIGSNAPSGEMVIYADSPYPTGTNTTVDFPTGTAITGLRWI